MQATPLMARDRIASLKMPHPSPPRGDRASPDTAGDPELASGGGDRFARLDEGDVFFLSEARRLDFFFFFLKNARRLDLMRDMRPGQPKFQSFEPAQPNVTKVVKSNGPNLHRNDCALRTK